MEFDKPRKPQCFSYSPKLSRCELPAGHSGNHSVSTEWTDEESYSPQQVAQASSVEQERVLRQMRATLAGVQEYEGGESETEHGYKTGQSHREPTKTDKCVACGHAHKGGPCKCSCYEFVG